MKVALTVGVLVALLGIAGYYSASVWQVGETSFGIHGWVALGIGAVATFAVGAGLMALVFYSARKGYDDQHDRSVQATGTGRQDGDRA